MHFQEYEPKTSSKKQLLFNKAVDEARHEIDAKSMNAEYVDSPSHKQNEGTESNEKKLTLLEANLEKPENKIVL